MTQQHPPADAKLEFGATGDLPPRDLPAGELSKRDLATRDLGLAIRRGLALRCPNCGQGHLFRAYLKPVEHCLVCGEDYSQIRADDGPAWLTILIAGHVVVGLILAFDSSLGWPLWQSMTVFPAIGFGLCLALLPFSKGVFIAAIWASQTPRRGG